LRCMEWKAVWPLESPKVPEGPPWLRELYLAEIVSKSSGGDFRMAGRI